jgi:hypothetical protein
MEQAYKGSKYALNINTVTSSATMFARRVFELMSSNTLVLTNYSKGVDLLFGENVVVVDDQVLHIANEDEKREAALYEVLSRHTYKNRFEQLLDEISFPYERRDEKVTLVYRISSLEEASESINHFYNMNWKEKKCWLLIDNNTNPSVLQSIIIKHSSSAVYVLALDYDKYEAPPKIKKGYVMNANTSISSDFIARAMLHRQYIDKNTGITIGEPRYQFGFVSSIQAGVLIPCEYYNFEEEREIEVYYF